MLQNNQTLLITSAMPDCGFERLISPADQAQQTIRIDGGTETANAKRFPTQALSPSQARLLAQSRQIQHLINQLADGI